MSTLLLLSVALSFPALAGQKDITGPVGSGTFGTSVAVLPNGNFVVTDPNYSAGAANVGAVHLYTSSGALISTLTGQTANDLVGSGGVTVLTNGNYVVVSPLWNNGAVLNVGAVTWCDGTTGISGAVSAANSLVGAVAGDQVGINGVRTLPSGNYVVISSLWNDGAVPIVGAVTWGNGSTGVSGPVSTSNSLTGKSTGDLVGSGGVTVLTNGNYVVRSPLWDDGAVIQAGAATWANGTTGLAGPVSAANSLIGSTAGDQVGDNVVIALSNGNYVVLSPSWSNGAAPLAGAATWGNGSTGITGPVSPANSLVGSLAVDRVGLFAIALTNGNYVVGSFFWNNGAAAMAGAATWGNGTTGISGPVSAANSLVGSSTNDNVGRIATALTNGNYVVGSFLWNNGAALQAGAATWGNGTTGISGPVSAVNSLVGSSTGDRVGAFVNALSNGNYVVASSSWSNGATASVGAATWSNGATGITGPVSPVNSLVGSTTNDRVGLTVARLTNGNYVVASQFWNNGATLQAGAATWANGSTGITGPVSAANSLVGSLTNDRVGTAVTRLTNGNYVVASFFWNNGAGAATWGNGNTGINGPVTPANSLVGSTASDGVGSFVAALTNGNYVVASPDWSNGGVVGAGAATWANGSTGITGPVSPANSLVGSTMFDQVGIFVTPLTNGNYVVRTPFWNNGAVALAGAVSLGNGGTGTVGAISPNNSVEGTATNGGPNLVFSYDPTRLQLVVGRPDSNIVTLFFPGPASKLVFAQQPTNTVFGAAINPAVTMQIQDATGNPTPGPASIAMALGANPSSGTLSGTTTAPLVSGTATFSDLSIDKTGIGYTLTATSAGFATLTSSMFNVIGGGTLAFVSAPTATPNVAGVGQTVAFNAVASEAGGAITYSWTFGDGTTATGSSPSHAFVTAGMFTATVTATDQTNVSVTGRVTVTVNDPIVGTGLDSDGDGFSDSLEIAIGTNPNDPASTPFGGLPAGAPQKLMFLKLSIKLNFAKSGTDSVTLTGTLSIPAGFKASGSTFGLFLSGISKRIVLDAKGHSPKGNDILVIQIKSSKGAVAAQTAKFTLKLTKGKFTTPLADAGLTNKTVKNESINIPVTVLFNSTVFQANVPQQYTASQGKTGATK
jgi:hypothetical protein